MPPPMVPRFSYTPWLIGLRKEKRYQELILEKEKLKKLNNENKTLGPRNKILPTHCNTFSDIVEELTDCKIEDILTMYKPREWRNFIMRLVCSTKGEQGNLLRKLWVDMYRGDLVFGIRDERRRAKELNWPVRKQHPLRKDRSSWISFFLRQYYKKLKNAQNKSPKDTQSN